MNTEVYHNDEKQALQWMQPLDGIMDIICKYLNGKDLSKMAKVCKSWRYAALREIGRRYCPLQLSLPYKIDNLASTLHVIPSASLFFFDRRFAESHEPPMSDFHSRFEWEMGKDFTEELLQDFKPQLPNETIVMKVDELHNIKLSGECDILGIFLPSAEHRVSVRVSWLHHRPANHIAEDLGINDCEYPKSTILLFYTSSSMDFVAELGRRAQQNGEEITLASIFGSSIKATNYHSDISQSNFMPTVGLRISGPSVESWSTFIPFFAQNEEIERKLQKLKEKVKPKRFYTGLFYAPKCFRLDCNHEYRCGNSRVTMRHLERFFPEISFTGFFTERHHTFYPNNIFSEGAVDRFDENDIFSEEFLRNLPFYASIIIISYD